MHEFCPEAFGGDIEKISRISEINFKFWSLCIKSVAEFNKKYKFAKKVLSGVVFVFNNIKSHNPYKSKSCT